MKLTAVQLDDLIKTMQPADQPPTGAPLEELYQSMKQEEKDKEDKQKAEEQKRSMANIIYSISLLIYFRTRPKSSLE
jgi:hypothetical protein